MNPLETQKILDQITATWPRTTMSDDTADAWAAALVTVDYETAKQAVVKHSAGERGNYPPDIADITAEQRKKQRSQRPASPALHAIQADTFATARDKARRDQRIAAAIAKLGPTGWNDVLGKARNQLVAEYNHTVIPTNLIANRACEIAETTNG